GTVGGAEEFLPDATAVFACRPYSVDEPGGGNGQGEQIELIEQVGHWHPFRRPRRISLVAPSIFLFRPIAVFLRDGAVAAGARGFLPREPRAPAPPFSHEPRLSWLVALRLWLGPLRPWLGLLRPDAL